MAIDLSYSECFTLIIDTFSIDARFVRGVKRSKPLRFFKMDHYLQLLNLLEDGVAYKKWERSICIFVVMITLILSPNMIYIVEYKAQSGLLSSLSFAMW